MQFQAFNTWSKVMDLRQFQEVSGKNVTTNYLSDPSRPMTDKCLAAFERRESVDTTYATLDQSNDQSNDMLTALVVAEGTLASFSRSGEPEARR